MKETEVRFYDSCFAESVTPNLARQIGEIYCSPFIDNNLQITCISVQLRRNYRVCGVLSIAAAFNAATRKNLQHITYDIQKMRSHLEYCFESEILVMFPPAISQVSRPVQANNRVPFCIAYIAYS